MRKGRVLYPPEKFSNFFPPNPFNDLMATLFNDEGTADLVLEVGKGLKKREFFAHRAILTKCAPDLAVLCEDCDKDKPLPLPDVDPDVFHELLRFVYGGKVAEDKWGSHYQDFIDTADQFGVVNLKIEAESRFVDAVLLTVDNVVDNLAYADSKNCPRLKEHAIKYIMEHPTEVFSSDSFKNFPISENIVKEIFFVSRLVPLVPQGIRVDATIGELRQKLFDKGLSADGSRETLMARLQRAGEGK